MDKEEREKISADIGLNEAHWAVILRDYTTLEDLLSRGDARIAQKTSEMLFCTKEQRDSRIFIAGDFFFPPSRVKDIPLHINFDKGSHPIHFAAAMGDVQALELFVRYKSNLNVKDGIGATPLHLACFYGHLEAAEVLLNPKTKINEGTKTKKSLVFYDAESTPLHAALSSGNLALVRWLLDKGADVSARTKFGCDAYFFAARGANPEIIRLLGETGLSIPAEGHYGNFPLLEAVKKDHYATVEMLLKAGSPLREIQGHESPIIKATENDSLAIRKLLIQYGANPLDYKGNLASAARNNDTTFIREYANEGKDLDVLFGDSTALMSAAATGRLEAVKLLLELGADVNVKPSGTALHWALANQHYEIANLILDYAPDCSAVNERGNSVLFEMLYAEVPNRMGMIQRMLALGANPHTVSRHGVSALSLAESEEDTELLALFEKVSSTDALDLRYVAPAHSSVLEHLSEPYDWKVVYQELWDELVPPSGNAHSLQGELVRVIGNLSDEFYRNGNINWDHNKAAYLESIAFLKTHLLDGSFACDEKALSAALVKLTHFNVVHYEKKDSPHRLITEAVVQWCAAHKTIIPLSTSA